MNIDTDPALGATSNTAVEADSAAPAAEHMPAQQIANPGLDIATLLDLLQRWELWGTEVRRRVYDLPPDLRFELGELRRENAQLRTDDPGGSE
jgi:hypothetical protein